MSEDARRGRCFPFAAHDILADDAECAKPLLRILHLEDDACDRALIARQLAAELPCELIAARDAAEYLRHLAAEPLDAILSDFSLPGFDGMSALARAREIKPDVPFIFVSGTIGEKRAVESLRAGATDYVFKDRLDRLPGAIRRAVREARERAERARAIAALRESEQRFRQVTEAIEEVFWLAELAPRRLIYVSPAYEKIWGRPREQLYGQPASWLDSVHPDERERVAAAEPLQATGGYDIQFRIVRPDRVVRWIRERAFPVKDALGRIYRIAGVAEDITARRQLEDQVRQSQKMESLGQFAAGIAHDFNNMLAVIKMQASLLETDPALPRDLHSGMRTILDAADRAANLTRQLLTFSRREVTSARDIDLVEVVAGTAKLLRRILGETIVLETRLASGLPRLHADPATIEQILMNLVLNARDAMPEGGRIEVALDSIEADAARVAPHPGAKPGRFVRLSVQDTGCGIAPEHVARIFEPFFTTKEPGRGTGLGLATVARIVTEQHGWIEVESAVGKGSAFRVFLPASPAALVAAPAEAERPVRGRGERILLLEDDTPARAIARLVLERFGYRVFDAPTAAAALQLWAEHRGRFDLLLTDLILPGGTSGRQLAERLLSAQPALKVVYTSGYSADIVGRQLGAPGAVWLLQKPYSAEALARLVRECLDARH